MKHLMIFSVLAATALSAAAQAPPDMSTVTIPRGPQTIELPGKVNRIWAGEFEAVQGVYDLSNGQTMLLTMRVNRKYIKVGDAPKTEVVAVGDYDFVALDRNYRVVLQEPVFGEVTGYLLMVPQAAGPRVSGLAPIKTTIASR